MTVNPEMIPRWAAKAHRYAAKFAAETVSYEPPTWVEPTDEAFAACFAHCVRVPPAEVYPLIREAFFAEYGPCAGAAASRVDVANLPLETPSIESSTEKRNRRRVAKPRSVETIAVTLPGMEAS